MSQTLSNAAVLKRWAREIPLARELYHRLFPAIPSNYRILRGAPAFVPYSAGSPQDLADMTMIAIDQTFPFLVDVLAAAGKPVLQPTAAADFDASEKGRKAAAALKELLDHYGSDKANHHNYHLVYGPILADPHEIRAILEVGLGTNNVDVVSNMGQAGRPGASLRAFRDFLPGARIFGADIDRRVLFEEERISTFFVDQTDPQAVAALGRNVSDGLDLVIDDGLHAPNANLAIMSLALRKLRVGGFLVIEDISPAALSIWQVVAALLPDRFRSTVIRAGAGLMFAVQRQR